jgi:hypothetical protein
MTTQTIIVLLIIGVIAAVFYLKRNKAYPLLPMPPAKTIYLTSTLPRSIKVGDTFTILYDVVQEGRLLPEKVTWWVERDPRAPLGGPDIPWLFIAGDYVLAIAAGTRVVNGSLAEAPNEKAISFPITVEED